MRKISLLLLALIFINSYAVTLPTPNQMLGGTLATVGTISAATSALSAALATYVALSEPNHSGGTLAEAGSFYLAFYSALTAITSGAIAYPSIKKASALLNIPQKNLYAAAAATAGIAVVSLFGFMLMKAYEESKQNEYWKKEYPSLF